MKSSSYEYADDIVSKAMMFAVSAHSGQFRKDGKTPAILHAMETSCIIGTMTHDLELMAAALLHDTVEDTDVTAEQVEMMFGKRVAYYVASETEDKHREMSAEDSWMIRKEESLKELETSHSIEVEMLWLSDKLSNIRSFYRMYRTDGDKMWNIFHQKDKSKHEWYYREIARILKKDLGDSAAYEEYTELLDKIFGKVK